jgi:hypothetical protein
MSTITFAAAEEAAGTSRSPTLLDRAFARVVAAREAKAKRMVNSYLARFSVAELRKLGCSDGRIAEIRESNAEAMLPAL